MGNYHQCLGIQETLPDLSIDGKYCTISVPLDQDLVLPSFPDLPGLPDFPGWPDIPWPELNPELTRIPKETHDRVKTFRSLHADGLSNPRALLSSEKRDVTLNLAICIPKACTTREAIDGMLFNTTAVGFQYKDDFCRLPGDKPWVAADYIAIVIFGTIAVITILSTAYDIRHNIILKREPKQINKLLQSFSVYTNTRRLVTYTSVPGTLECLDGIRVMAMLWVIVGHTYVTKFNESLANPLDVLNWMTSFSSLWITSAPFTVDTFFMISGLLVVYTTAGKLTRMNLLKNLHFFYLNRLLRMFPVLAAFVLLQASILNWISDGPNWTTVAQSTNSCRVFWWSTLLHIQNYVNPGHMCVAQTWYLAVDVQMHILSPLVLFWVLGTRRRVAWTALTVAMILALVPATVYNVIMEFPAGPVTISRASEQAYYMFNYYVNTLTRCSPFFVGMIYGYLLHLNKGRVVMISKLSATVLWLCATILSTTVFMSSYPILQSDWDNQAVDTTINSVSRPAWALAIGWMVFACVHGYGGPINWYLSLKMWKFPSRLSYAMYIVHYSLMFVVNSTAITPYHFTVMGTMYRFFGDLGLTLVLSFVLTVTVDSPCSTLIKHFLGNGPKRQQVKPSIEEEKEGEFTGRINHAYISDETKSKL
ncbi:O-acyltransferase like protein isoform X2 [Manduca sexta]|nr:O-acyltransferase like protein isoform X2 [Manduca sexta]